jgi:hypothetical protein
VFLLEIFCKKVLVKIIVFRSKFGKNSPIKKFTFIKGFFQEKNGPNSSNFEKKKIQTTKFLK